MRRELGVGDRAREVVSWRQQMCRQAFDPVLCPKNLAAVLSDLQSWETNQGSQVKGNSEVKTVIAIKRKSVYVGWNPFPNFFPRMRDKIFQGRWKHRDDLWVPWQVCLKMIIHLIFKRTSPSGPLEVQPFSEISEHLFFTGHTQVSWLF